MKTEDWDGFQNESKPKRSTWSPPEDDKCDTCNGSGEVFGYPCEDCEGHGG